MNPNQSIIALGSASLTVATICLLIQIAILATTMTLHFKQNEYTNTSKNQVVPCESITIERNITEIVHLNGTIIEKENCPRASEYKNWSKPQCQITGFVPFSKDNSIRLSAGGDIWVTREPYVSCGLNKCYQFALGQGTTLNNKHSNGTTHDRSPYRPLFMSELGVPFHFGTKQVCIVWSSSSCHDGKAWLHVCVSGDDRNASARFFYDGMFTDSIVSWSKNILRPQESECVCINGTCAVVMTDGSASGGGDSRIFFFREGEIVHFCPLSGSAQHVGECFFSPRSPEFRCFCRDNWKGSNRPVLYINVADYSFVSIYVCSGFFGDTPRSDDSSRRSKCRDPNNERGSPGVKGWAFDSGNDFWMGRTIKKDSRAGYEFFKVIGGWNGVNSKSQINRQVIFDSDGWGGFFGIFSFEGKICLHRCFYVELIRGSPRGARVWGTSNSFFVFCGISGTEETGSWPEGADIIFLPI
ncbi:neuraminidase [Influenza A virus (A/chicken/Egypt/D4692A/2012(H9N2))]|uniref:Neuraminidase n=1 Tax=Influenza A virus (A/chicken/Egypt/D4692A/2012(H9N2)) TaxID=1240574 RepID=K7QQ82_9INFA|nr:neuraminidase [Influenza A virus (A/chicken/Egypt/D4692A/2012(H9N2))]